MSTSKDFSTSSAETPEQPSASGANNHPVVIFLLNKLGLEPLDQFSEGFDVAARLTATYHPALNMVLGTPLRHAGKIKNVYLNFGNEGIFKFEPEAIYVTENMPAQFETNLGDLLQNERLYKRLARRTRIEIAKKIPDMTTVFAALPENCQKIGCLSGPDTTDVPYLTDFLHSVGDDHSFLIVVGDFTDAEISSGLDKFVKVSEYELEPTVILARIGIALAEKWKID